MQKAFMLANTIRVVDNMIVNTGETSLPSDMR